MNGRIAPTARSRARAGASTGQRRADPGPRPLERFALYAAVLAAGAAFSILFSGVTLDGFAATSLVGFFGGRAFPALFGAAAVALAVGSAGRFRFVLLFPAVVVYTLLAVYGAPRHLLSTSGWKNLFFQVGVDLYRAAGVMYIQPLPYDLTRGLLVVFVPMVMVICAFATSATLYERAPVITIATLGLTLGVISTINFEAGAGPFFAVFAASSVALLLACGTRGRSSARAAGVLAGALVLGLVLIAPRAPFSNETVSPGAVDWTKIGVGGTSRLNVQADVGSYLTNGRDTELMRVTSSEPLLWRGGTLDHFDGARWTNTTLPGEDDGEEIAPGVPTRTVVEDVQVLGSQTNIIFGGYRIDGVSSGIGGATRNADGSWTASRTLSRGDFYRVFSEVPQPTAAQLRSAGTNYPASVGERFLQLPRNTPAVVDQTANKIRRNYDTRTPYDKARAVERYLRSDGGFTYNLNANFNRADWAINDFLGSGKQGFCTQFATSMALILRDMNVPTRVVYGATTGEQTGRNTYLVRGENMHTWVEVYFPNVGWYPFDPTPGFSMPETMQANAPQPSTQRQQGTSGSENRALNKADPGKPQIRRDIPNAPQQNPRTPETPRTKPQVPQWPVFGLVAALLLAASPLAKRALRARGRPEDLYHDLTARLRDALPLGRSRVADPEALTVSERLTLLAGAAGLDEKPFLEFARAYSDYLYAPREGSARKRELARSYRRATSEYGKLPLWRRALAALNPASLARRARRTARLWWSRLRKEVRLWARRLHGRR